MKQNKKILIIGVGYVGLTKAISFAMSNLTRDDKFDIYCYDINDERIDELNNNYDKNYIFTKEDLEKCKNDDFKLFFTSKENNISNIQYDYIFITVPVNIDSETLAISDYNITKATKFIASNTILKDNKTLIVYESTVYPGFTNKMISILENKGKNNKYNLKLNKDFSISYSPERISPLYNGGVDSITRYTKLVSATNEESLENLSKLYESIGITVYKSKSIEVAEVSKLIENSQTDVEVALIHELKQLCLKLGISIYDVLDSVNTKSSYHGYIPGMIGGDCIHLSSLLLLHSSVKHNVDLRMTQIAREKNRSRYITLAQKVANIILRENRLIKDFRICIIGLAFKPNVAMFNNSQSSLFVKELYTKFNLKNIGIYDPYITKENLELAKESLDLYNGSEKNGEPYIIEDISKEKDFDMVVLVINHKDMIITEELTHQLLKDNGIFVNITDRKMKYLPKETIYYQ